MLSQVARQSARGWRRAAPLPRWGARMASTAAPRAMRGDALVPAVLAAGAGAAALLVALRGDPALAKRVGELEVEAAEKTSSAFVFIKPHAVTEDVKALVKKELAAAGIVVKSEGAIPAETIDKQQLIDTHYGAIAAKAVKLSPSELTVQPKAQEEFEQAFGLTWSDAVSQGAVFNAMQGAEALGITPEELGARWGTLSKGVDMLKFGGGFYCGKIEDVFIINGFYMNMRSKFTTPGTCIYYFETEWDARMLSWQDFRAKVLGATDPAAAVEGSIRNLIFTNWEALGLAACPDTGDNGVHASASPFEALAERSNWLGTPLARDPYGKAMLASGVPMRLMKAWTDDPPVTFEGKKQSIFDLLEDLDGRECLQKSAKIAKEN